MRMTELSLYTQNFQEQYYFYTTILGLPLREKTLETFTVQAGATRLTFQQSVKETLYHFAFTIPSNKLASAKEWLVERAPLLTQNGEDEFSFEAWNADSIYFRDTANHILEFIAHHDPQNGRPGAFETADILHISEIGLVFEQVPAQAKTLIEQFGLEPFRGEIEERFAALGDVSGRFICVATGRNWFPTSSAAIVSPLEVTIEGSQGQEQQLIPYPYHVFVR